MNGSDSAFFGNWTPRETRATGPLRDASRELAEYEFEQLMAARPQRLAALSALASRHGVDVTLPNASALLGTWIIAVTHQAGPDALTGQPAWLWAGLASDVALWLGERIITTAARTGGALRWQLYTGIKKSTGYQRAVLTGFRRVDDPRYYVDVAHFVASWFELAARRRPARADFLATIETTTLADA